MSYHVEHLRPHGCYCKVEVARLAGCCVAAVETACRRGELPAVEYPGEHIPRWFRDDDVAVWLARRSELQTKRIAARVRKAARARWARANGATP